MELREIVLRRNMLGRLLEHAEQWYPKEGVALLFGHVSKQRGVVDRVALVDNSAASETTFRVKPEEQYRLLVESEERGEEMIGVFHSHPSSAQPSKTDLENMRLNPVVWIVASREEGSWDYASFVLDSNGRPDRIDTRIQ
ncbi:M67 family peptidase [Candidatus Thorarchaeota archaeon]|nr:MAG: M67 family peptidase [Candidatus Thorarchaeota archaeon]